MESQSAITLNDLNHQNNGPSATTINSSLEIEDRVQTQHEFSLPRSDGGKDAWLFLAAGFVVEALVWGFPFSFGIFQEYYSTHEPFSPNPSGIAVIGTTATGIMYMAGLVLFPLYKKYPKLANTSKWAGLPLMAAALIAASFMNTVEHLILTQGALYAFGGCIIYYPTLLYIDEWFIQRKGLAYGVIWAGTGAAGLLIPFILNHLLTQYGYRTTLRVWAVTLLLLSSPLIYFLRPRMPPSSTGSHSLRYGLSFLTSPTFWILQLGLAIESLGYFIPSIYLPLYSTSLGLPPSIGTLLVALLNLAGVFATIIMGFLCDRFHVTTVILLSASGATISVLLFWGLANALPLLVVFSVVYGFFAGGFVSTNAGVIRLVKIGDGGTDIGALIGVISACRGIGAVLSGPLSERLIKSAEWGTGKGGTAYAGEYGGLVVFTGVTAAIGGMSYLWKRLGWM